MVSPLREWDLGIKLTLAQMKKGFAGVSRDKISIFIVGELRVVQRSIQLAGIECSAFEERTKEFAHYYEALVLCRSLALVLL